jgi:hypothetical protein
MIPTKKTNKIREIHHKAYLTSKGQTGNNTIAKIKQIMEITIHFLDSVVSKRNDAYFLSRLEESTGYKDFGYLIFIL